MKIAALITLTILSTIILVLMSALMVEANTNQTVQPKANQIQPTVRGIELQNTVSGAELQPAGDVR